uniref:Protein kinase domain-containing protein n=1 Tax=Physcomitrium patens TaxID=3218 RepID=A0A7I4FUS4_PHYPA
QDSNRLGNANGKDGTGFDLVDYRHVACKIRGVVKITDFGLGKIIKEEPEPQRMELMSQVAEFYCEPMTMVQFLGVINRNSGAQQFAYSSVGEVDKSSALVSGRCEMIFGNRPSGHNQCQEQLMRKDTRVNAAKVEFPARTFVSLELIVIQIRILKRCLTHDEVDRPDPLTAVQYTYLSSMKKKLQHAVINFTSTKLQWMS